MAALAETRGVGSNLPMPSSVRRVCCIGDSLTYGQGVAPRQTLAAHAARYANMVYLDQLVWVDNLGQSSGNIWHSWVPFVRLSEFVKFDAAIFSLCQNDSQIFESTSVRYQKAWPWVEDGKLQPALRRTFEELKVTASKLGTQLIIDFYTLWDNDAPIVEAVAQECARVGLPFVNLLDFFKEESGLSIAEFVASPFDGHPSDSGHRAAARRIVEELRERWVPPSPAGSTVSEQLLDVYDQAVSSGWSPDDITQWALLVIDAKETIVRRRRSRPEAAFVGDLTGARKTIEERYRRWYQRGVRLAQARALHEHRDKLEANLESTYATIRSLDEMSFVLATFKDKEIVNRLWTLLREAGYFTEQGRLHDLPVDLKAKLQALAGASNPCAGRDNASPIVMNFTQLRRDFNHTVLRLASFLPDRLEERALNPDVAQLWKVAHYLVNTARSYHTQFEAIASQETRVAATTAHFTTVDVKIERDATRPKKGGVFNLTVEIDYVEPLRARRRYKLWAGADADAYVYRFEMPLLLFGEVGVGVPAWDDLHKRFLDGELRLAGIEISNGHDAASSGMRFHWQPPLDTAPIHWVNFNRLLVPS